MKNGLCGNGELSLFYTTCTSIIIILNVIILIITIVVIAALLYITGLALNDILREVRDGRRKVIVSFYHHNIVS